MACCGDELAVLGDVADRLPIPVSGKRQVDLSVSVSHRASYLVRRLAPVVEHVASQRDRQLLAVVDRATGHDTHGPHPQFEREAFGSYIASLLVGARVMSSL